MDRLQQQQKRSSKRYHGLSGKMSSLFDLKSHKTSALDRAYGEGNGHMDKQMYERRVAADSSFVSRLPSEKNSFPTEFGHSSLKRSNGTPMKMLLAKELSKETAFRRRSPGVIGKLMGLDALPTYQPVYKQQKSSKSYFQKTRSTGLQEKFVTNKDHFFTKGSRVEQEFKDVFEVMETPKDGKINIRSVDNVIVGLELNEAKMAFLRQKFMDSKRFSTLQNFHQSPDFGDAEDVLDSNKDLFLRFLQEPNSLFKKHLHDLQAVPSSPQSGDVRVLKSEKATKHSRSKIYLESEGRMEGHMRSWKDVTDSLQKQEHARLTHNKHGFNISHRVSKSQFEGNTKTCPLPTRIVVLKPSHSAHDRIGSVSAQSSSGSSHSSHGKHREYRRSRSQEFFPELRNRQESESNEDTVRDRPKVSREIDRVITQRVKRTVGSDANCSISALKGYSGDESSDSMSGRESIKDSETLAQSSRHFYDWRVRCSSPSSSNSAESSVSREAKKRLSERWKMTQKFQEVGLGGRGSSTLGEMLALPDKERLLTVLGSKIAEIGPINMSSVNQVLERDNYPLGVSGRDSWNDGSIRNRPRSRSLSTSSIVYRSPKTRSRHGSLDADDRFMFKEVIVVPDKCFKEHPDQKEASFSVKLGSTGIKSESYLHRNVEEDPPIRDIHINSVGQHGEPELVCLSEQIPVVPEQSFGVVGDTRKFPDHLPVSECRDNDIKPDIQEELLSEPAARIALMDSIEESTLCDCDHNGLIEDVMKETSLNRLEVESHGHVAEPVSPHSSKEVEQPSPVSVLEPPNEAEFSSSECFESISAGLHGLRMQLRLLKLDSAEAPIEGTDVIVSSDEEETEGCDGLVDSSSVIFGLSTSMENREYLFLLDMLIDSGFHTADFEMLFATSYSLEFPVAPCMFDNLEKKYDDQLAWPRWERRFLFDRINSVLAEILRLHMDLHPWVKPTCRRAGRGEQLVDQVWKLLDTHGKGGLGETAEKEIGRDMGWLELGDDIDAVGREIEGSLMNDLLDEVISEILMVGA